MRLTAVHSEPILRLLSTLNEVSLLSEPRQRRGGVMKEAGVGGTAEGRDFLAAAIPSEPIAQTPRV